MSAFKVGDKIQIVNGIHKGEIGIIKAIEPDMMHAVEVNDLCGHDCNGFIPSGYGHWVHEKNMKIVREEKKMSTFKVGDRVNITSRSWGPNTGTIMFIDRDHFYAIKIDGYEGRGHDCEGHVKGNAGRWMNTSEFEMLKEEKKMKFGVGDRIMIRYWDDMIAEFGDKGAYIESPNSRTCFPKSMSNLSGRQATISRIEDDDVELSDWSDGTGDMLWSFSPYMLILVKKAEPKKQLSVAEVEKLLGYGVEIVKESK